ncbi:MAG: RNA polymerase sigma factor [Candidatus Aminicenantes bacterium]|nr:RNA polymerase sigma factor [Candidatus Aminicenantes bacterium]
MDIQDIVKKLKAGDTEAWNMLVESFSKKVYNLALNFAGNKDDAAEMTQEIFLKIYNNIDKFEEERNFSSWVMKLSKNYCIDFWRKTKSSRQNIELDENLYTNSVHDHALTPEDSLIQKNDIAYLRRKLQQLPPDLRSLIIMRDIQDYSYQEISESLDIPLGTTKSRINRARLKLAQLILNERKRN